VYYEQTTETRIMLVNRSWLILCFLPLASLIASSLFAQSATFHISPNGDEAFDGSEFKPFRSIPRAQQAVREHLKTRTKPGDVVVILHGRHFLSQPLLFTPDDTPNDGSVVAYKSQPDNPATISGGRIITGWKQNQHLWQVEIDEVKTGQWQFRELFAGGHRRNRACSPNSGYFRIVKAGSDNRTSFQFKPGDLQRISKPGRAEILFLHDWSISRVGVQDIDVMTSTIRLLAPIGRPAPYFAITGFEKHPRYKIENAPELLDSPGEWYLDQDTGVLSYWPLEGESLEKTEIIAPVLSKLVHVQGNELAGRAVRNLRFEGLSFAHCAWTLPPGGYAESQATVHATRHGDAKSPQALVPAAITFDAAEACATDQCRFEHLGGSAAWFRRACRGNRVTKSQFIDVAASAVNVGEPQVHVPSQQAVAAGSALGPVSQGNAITHCRIERCGALYHGAVGVWIGMAKATEVSSNEIRDLPYTGISVGWNWSPTPTVCEGHLIASNHIHHVMQVLSDGGGIYTLGRQPGTVLRGNIIHDVSVNAGRAESNGIFMDEGSTELLVENNVIYNIAKSPIRFHKAGKNVLRNNQLITRPKVPAFRYNDTKEKLIVMEGNKTIEAEHWQPPPGLVPVAERP
jgi:hypothetical protein